MAALATLAIAAPTLPAQDTLQLVALQEAAVARDPRGEQAALLRAASALRETALDMERRPQLALNGAASHQSDVTAVRLALPGASVPLPPKDRWQATLDAQQLLYDGGALAARRALERARLDESSAGVDVGLYRLRAEVNAAFFSAYLLQERTRELEALLGDLDARLRLARSRVLGGVSLPRDTSAIVAEQLRAELARAEARASREAALAVLARLTGRAITAASVLQLPDLAATVARAAADGAPDALRARPEFAQFARTRLRLDREAALARAENRPRLVAFGQGGIGRPGLNQFLTQNDEFWQAGVRFEWRPWTWRSAERAGELLQLQQRVVATEERALADQLARAVEGDLAEIGRLRDALATDERIVALRQDMERQARAQFTEGVLTSADYVEARTDVLEARLAQQRRRAELAQAQARYLTTLGLVPRTRPTVAP
jgi:outer membrane protein TolC